MRDTYKLGWDAYGFGLGLLVSHDPEWQRGWREACQFDATDQDRIRGRVQANAVREAIAEVQAAADRELKRQRQAKEQAEYHLRTLEAERLAKETAAEKVARKAARTYNKNLALLRAARLRRAQSRLVFRPVRLTLDIIEQDLPVPVVRCEQVPFTNSGLSHEIDRIAAARLAKAPWSWVRGWQSRRYEGFAR